MMVEVIYYSMTGNTKKLAEAIATELNVAAESVSMNTKLADQSLLFLGTGLYGPFQGRGLKRFIHGNHFEGRKVALFGTSGEGKGREVGALEGAVTKKGAAVVGKFHCKGEFLFFINRKHPMSKDLKGARNFARQLADG